MYEPHASKGEKMKQKITKISVLFFAVGLLITFTRPATLPAGNDPLPRAEEIIEKAIEASGRRGAYEKISNRKTITVMKNPINGMEMKVTTYQERPNKYYAFIDMGTMGKMELGTD